VPRITDHFNLGKTQAELDFVDVRLHTDNRLFVDPFALAQRQDSWSREAADTLNIFFQQVVDYIRAGNDDKALELLLHLREPNETRLGYSRKKPKGAGLGSQQAEEVFAALKASSAVKTGFISSLEECELMIDGIGRDKISDLTTNVIRHHLIEYTQAQCELHSIPIQSVSLPLCFDSQTMTWEEVVERLPVYKGQTVLFVPKSTVRYVPAYQRGKYYQHFVLNFLKERELANPQSSLVKVFRRKKETVRKVFKKDLKKHFPNTKNYLFEFSRENPNVLRAYRESLKSMERSLSSADTAEEDETVIAASLVAAMKSIAPGDKTASDYHKLMVGIAEFIFFPSLLHPRKEKEIHDGRKRIDIVMENGATKGPFFSLPTLQHIQCLFVPFECKNYGREVGNPELDQLTGRLSVNRGMVGVLCCRNFKDRELFIKRCRDTFKDRRGLVIPLDDGTVLQILEQIEKGQRAEVDGIISNIIAEVILS
jgi:hypothetical protein